MTIRRLGRYFQKKKKTFIYMIKKKNMNVIQNKNSTRNNRLMRNIMRTKNNRMKNIMRTRQRERERERERT